MWHIFKNKEQSKIKEKIAGTVAGLILRRQLKLAEWLEAKDRKLLPGQRKVLFLSLGILFICWLLWLSINLFHRDPKAIKAQWLRHPRDSIEHHGPVYLSRPH